MKIAGYLLLLLTCMSCTGPDRASERPGVSPPPVADTVQTAAARDSFPPANIPDTLPGGIKPIAAVTPHELVGFAKTLTGVPYLYASADPAQGFDCSGFITYVFNHFHITVPRSSVDFTNVGREVTMREAREGDLVLFTGTNDSIRIVGHMGIVTENTDSLRFIHSSSGKAKGVTITPLNEYYRKRFVKVIRVFAE